jgi:8-oxo-dGTP pyrophosphatase MutT (NUDIX family)
MSTLDSRWLQKVTVFILRNTPEGRQILLFEHPYAGIQIPAGTVEPGEDPMLAARREAREETGLELGELSLLACRRIQLPTDTYVTCETATAYSRPDPASFDWVRLRRGITVTGLRREAGFIQVNYQEEDRAPGSRSISYQITGWVHAHALSEGIERYFYQAEYAQPSPPRWVQAADNHHFTLFWAPLDPLPEIIHTQAAWLGELRNMR